MLDLSFTSLGFYKSCAIFDGAFNDEMVRRDRSGMRDHHWRRARAFYDRKSRGRGEGARGTSDRHQRAPLFPSLPCLRSSLRLSPVLSLLLRPVLLLFAGSVVPVPAFHPWLGRAVAVVSIST